MLSVFVHLWPLSWCSHLEFLPLMSMLPNRGWKIKIVWFLFAKCLVAFIVVIRSKEHDQDGGNMIKVYCPLCEPSEVRVTFVKNRVMTLLYIQGHFWLARYHTATYLKSHGIVVSCPPDCTRSWLLGWFCSMGDVCMYIIVYSTVCFTPLCWLVEIMWIFVYALLKCFIKMHNKSGWIIADIINIIYYIQSHKHIQYNAT